MSTRPDIGAGRVSRRIVDVGGVGVGGTGLCPLLCSHVETLRLTDLDSCIGFQGEQWCYRCRRRCRLVLEIPMKLSRIGNKRRIAHKGELWVYRHSLLLVLKMSRGTLSTVNLTPYVYHTSPKIISLRLMPSDGWREPVEQLSLIFQLHVRELEASRRNCRMWRSGGGATIDQPVQRGREQAHEWGDKTPDANGDVGELAGALVFGVRAPMWMQPEPLGWLG